MMEAEQTCDIIGLLLGLKRPLRRKLRKKSDKGVPAPPGLGQKTAQEQ